MFGVLRSTTVRFKPQLGQEIGMPRILVSQRGHRLPAYKRKTQTIKPTNPLKTNAVETGE
jgi:hypothetical protein